MPFKANNIEDLHKLILKGEFEFPIDTITEEAKDLVRRMLILRPEERISVPAMLDHPWMKEMGDTKDEFGEDSEHDLKVGATFCREECMDGMIG